MTHQVRKANFRLLSRSEALASDERQRWQEWFEQTFPSLLGSLLNDVLEEHQQGYSGADVVLEIDRLQFDLGLLKRSDPVDQLVPVLKRQIRQQLQAQAPRIKHVEQSRFQQYQFFLGHGYWRLPEQPDMLAVMEQWLQGAGGDLLQVLQLLRQQRQNQALWLRFFMQHSLSFLDHFIGISIGRETLSTLEAMQGWASLSGRDQAFLLCYVECFTDERMPGLDPATEQALRDRIEQSRQSETDLLHWMLSRSGTFIEGLLPTKPENSSKTKAGNTVDDAPDEQEGATESVLVQQAGIVLLHPFLEHLFKKFAWLDAANKLHPDSRVPAVHALHFAVTGQEDAPEHELFLHKVLLGIPASFPIPRTLNLDEAIETEIETLLQALIGHWSALKNTSINGLREGFLQRQGSLRQEDDGLSLHVESKAQDILLVRLPWSIQAFALPWLDKPVFVNWSSGGTV